MRPEIVGPAGDLDASNLSPGDVITVQTAAGHYYEDRAGRPQRFLVEDIIVDGENSRAVLKPVD